MDNIKVGNLIRRLRKEKQMTQLQLAEKLNVSDKAVSKWERGMGCPEVSLMTELSQIFDVDMENLIVGELNKNSLLNGNLRKMHYYVCPYCGNLITSMTDLSVSCCGRKLKSLIPQKADETEKLKVEIIDHNFFVSSEHEMTKAHYITFVALVRSDSIIFQKQYPEWNLQAHIPFFAHGRLLWYCSQHGLFYQEI